MKPLFVLLTAFLLSVLMMQIFFTIDLSLAGRIAMTTMLLFTAIGHFAFPKGMANMLPPFVPFKKMIVFISGIFEIIAAAGLLFSNLLQVTSWLLIVFFILILPANIYAAVHRVNYQTGEYNGPGISYLWIRIPMQLFFIGWICYFCIYLNTN